MGLRLEVEIKESQEELEKAVKYATQASSKERLQMLYWLKTGQVTSRRSRLPWCPLGTQRRPVGSLAEHLGRDQATLVG